MDLVTIRRKILLNAPYLENASGNTFTTDMIAPLKECNVGLNLVQDGTGVPHPNNIRPIKGWDVLTVQLSGKNLYNKDNDTIGYYINSNGDMVAQPDYWNVSDYIPVSGEYITYNGLTWTGTAPMSAWYDKNKNLISTFKHTSGVNTIAIPDGAKYVRFSIYTNGRYEGDTFQVELGQAASNYQVFNGNNAIYNLTDTVYAGTFNFANGTLTAEWVDFQISKIEYSQGSTNWDQLKCFSSQASNINSVISDAYSQQNSSGTLGRLSWWNNNLFFNIPSGQLPSQDDVGAAAWYEQYRPQFVCQLKTPATYQFTPQQINTISGLDTIITNGDDIVSVKYWIH